MTRKATPNSTLEDLEGERWPEPNWPSHLVSECHRLRKLQLRLFTVENLRIMLGQDIGSRYPTSKPSRSQRAISIPAICSATCFRCRKSSGRTIPS